MKITNQFDCMENNPEVNPESPKHGDNETPRPGDNDKPGTTGDNDSGDIRPLK